MCGICGILAFDDRFELDRQTLVRMRDTLSHRGPDDAGVVVHDTERVGLAHRRLAIVDLSAAGHQPMANEDGTIWITYNGEVYNHDSLRAELEAKGHRFRSLSDTEAILHLYEEEGPDCVNRLHGMFAFAIWDGPRRELFLARDRVGVKPLYYAVSSSGFTFGSEAKALLQHPATPRELDEQALTDYLTFGFTPPPRTMYGGISKLAPAERMIVRADGSLQQSRYWTPFSAEVADEVAQMSETEMVIRIRQLLLESVGKRMMSDVPFGVFLSGGVDSSANVALMAELTGRPVRTFSTAPRGHTRYDELPYARMIADRYATDHHEILIDERDMEEFIPWMIYHEDEPIADWTAVPQHFVSRLARDSGTVVIQCGEGADELFHGYKGYADHRRYVASFQRVPQPLRRALGTGAARVTRGVGRGIRHGEALYDAGHSPLPYWGGALCFRGEIKDRILHTDKPPADSYAMVERHWHEADGLADGADVLQKITYVELKQRLPELLLMRLDKIGMANSIEGREPFLDHRLVEFALALPPRMKVRRGISKYGLKRAVSDLLPEQVVSRPKQGFGTPMEEWLRGGFGSRAQKAIRSSALAQRNLLDHDVIDRLFAAHRSGRGDWSKHLWNVYNLSLWHDRWIAGEPGH